MTSMDGFASGEDKESQQLAPWAAVAAVGTGAFALVTSEFLPVGLLPQIAQDLNVSPGQAGLLVALLGIIAAVTAPLTLGFAGDLSIGAGALLGGVLVDHLGLHSAMAPAAVTMLFTTTVLASWRQDKMH